MKVPKNWAGKPKSYVFIQFHSLSEAGTALSRFQASFDAFTQLRSLIGDQRVVVSYAQPESAEALMQAKARKEAEELHDAVSGTL
eukprot:274512-Amphidinium_carterae.1